MHVEVLMLLRSGPADVLHSVHQDRPSLFNSGRARQLSPNLAFKVGTWGAVGVIDVALHATPGAVLVVVVAAHARPSLRDAPHAGPRPCSARRRWRPCPRLSRVIARTGHADYRPAHSSISLLVLVLLRLLFTVLLLFLLVLILLLALETAATLLLPICSDSPDALRLSPQALLPRETMSPSSSPQTLALASVSEY